MRPEKDVVERCLGLYLKHWGFRSPDQLSRYEVFLRNSDVRRSIISRKLRVLENIAWLALPNYPSSKCHKAQVLFYRVNLGRFFGHSVLEIGPGFDFNSTPVLLSSKYHGIDIAYDDDSIIARLNSPAGFHLPTLYDPPPVSDRAAGPLTKWIRRMMEDDYSVDTCKLFRSLRFVDACTSDSGLDEWTDRPGKIHLIAGRYQDLEGRYDVVINGNAPVEESDIKRIRSFTGRDGAYVFIAPPDAPIYNKGLITEFFNHQQEIWIELRGIGCGAVYTAFVGSDNPDSLFDSP